MSRLELPPPSEFDRGETDRYTSVIEFAGLDQDVPQGLYGAVRRGRFDKQPWLGVGVKDLRVGFHRVFNGGGDAGLGSRIGAHRAAVRPGGGVGDEQVVESMLTEGGQSGCDVPRAAKPASCVISAASPGPSPSARIMTSPTFARELKAHGGPRLKAPPRPACRSPASRPDRFRRPRRSSALSSTGASLTAPPRISRASSFAAPPGPSPGRHGQGRSGGCRRRWSSAPAVTSATMAGIACQRGASVRGEAQRRRLWSRRPRAEGVFDQGPPQGLAVCQIA